MAYDQNEENHIDSNQSNQEIKEFDINSILHPNDDVKHQLFDFAESKNILADLDDEQVSRIRGYLLGGIMEDQSSMTVWLQSVEDAQRLSKLTKEPKNTPLPQSANIKIPLITDACYQFAARTYPEIIQDGKVVKMDIIGLDADGSLTQLAEQGSLFMNYQLLGPDSEWEASTDKLLVVLANIGFVLKKTYFDPIKKKNVSDICNNKDIILRNDPSISCLNDLRRICHVLHIHPNDLVEQARAGLYDEDVVKEILNFYAVGALNPECDLYECHCYRDLDDDGYEEPYIITIHHQTNKIVRVKARYTRDDIELDEDNKKVLRINPIQYFTDYHFLPSPDGCFMGMGFGTLLLHLNETANTIMNQLIDAGKLANMQTGFIDSRIKIMGGQMSVDPGQWNRVKAVIGEQLKDGVFPLNYKEPSTVLYQLLGMIMQISKDLTSSTDIMQGAAEVQNVPATSMLAMVEQGMKRFSAIQKRLYRSLKDEYQKLFRLNGVFGDPAEFANVTGNTQITLKDVFNHKNLRVFPVADPNLASDAQRLAQAQVVGSLMGKPGINNAEVYTRILTAAKVPHPEKIAPPQLAAKANNPPNPQLMKVQADHDIKTQQNQIKSRAQDLKEKEFAAKLVKLEAEVTKLQAQSVDLVASAKSKDHGDNIASHNAALDTIKTKMDALSQAHQQQTQHNIESKSLQLEQQKADQQHQQAMTGLGLQAHQQSVDQDQGQQQLDQQQDQANADQEAPSNNVDQSSGNGSSDSST